jgi:nucleoside-diphosphate-sugar epimerase
MKQIGHCIFPFSQFTPNRKYYHHMDFENIVISGATGWLGSELIAELLKNTNFEYSNIVPVSSSEGTLKLKDRVMKHSTFEKLNHTYSNSCYFDFAFLTREKLRVITEVKYKEINLKIIENSVNFIKANKPKMVVLASSGAIYGSNWGANSTKNDLYGELKLLQEIEIGKACRESGSKLITIRIFNLSGSGIRKIDTFAIAEFVFKSLKNENIFIKSNYLVTRRYCDISQLLKLVLRLILDGKDLTFDTGGIKLEIRELAKITIEKLGSSSTVKSFEISNSLPPDNYFSKSNEFEKLVKRHLKEAPISIDNQIDFTRRALLNQDLI